MHFRKINNNKGFSLIGVIISMAVISIMAAMSLPALKGMVFENRAGNVALLANGLINAESTYVNNNNQFSTISALQGSGYLAQGLGLNFVNGNPYSDCIYGSITAKNDTKICLSVNNSVRNGTSQEISYTLAISSAQNGEPDNNVNYYEFYSEIRHNIPGSAVVGGNEIIYIDPIAVNDNQGGAYSQYVGKSFYITGAICYVTETAYINSGRGLTYTRIWDDGNLALYFIVEAINGNMAILNYANNPYSECEVNSSDSNNAGDSYSYSSWVGGAFQSPYLPEVWGTVKYPYWHGGMNYVPVEVPGYEIEISANYLPDLINLNQSNTLN
jgi:type II secretory pathway pseudopilin PulG